MARSRDQATVVGSGPNGLAAAIALQQSGVHVRLLEASETIGGGMRTAELTLPGYLHDVCSAVHPMAAASPFFKTLPLADYGLEFIDPPVLAAHPLDGGDAAVLLRSFEETVRELGADGRAYRELVGDLVQDWPLIAGDLLGPPRIPSHPVRLARFGIKALMPSTLLSKRFHSTRGRGLFAGMAAHSIQPLSAPGTSAIALMFFAVGHVAGWPVAKGGSQKIANALAAYFRALGGKIETGVEVKSLDELPAEEVVLFDLTPKQLLEIVGSRFPPHYRRQLSRFRYGPGVFKLDWALSGAIPFTAAACRRAGTVHIGGSFEEIARSEADAFHGRISERPFILLAQQSLFDRSRVPDGKQTAWAYCHVPNGSPVDMTEAIERQIERFAPGFRDIILARRQTGPAALEAYDANYIGGDITGGAMNLAQIFMRPAPRWSPYTTPIQTVYLCSASTPPGGGIHGQCGYHAARRVLHDHFPDHAAR